MARGIPCSQRDRPWPLPELRSPSHTGEAASSCRTQRQEHRLIMSIASLRRFKLRGPSAVGTSVDTATLRSLRHPAVRCPTTPASFHTATAGKAPPDHDSQNAVFGSHFPHTREPAA